MQRELMVPRPDWPQKMEEVGFHFHSIDGIYWDERARYALTAAEVDMLEAATNELHEMCIAAAQHVIDRERFHLFAIPDQFVQYVVDSWNSDDATLFGRFDLAWDGHSQPKLLEYNADTPTALVEASVAQWYWLQDVKPSADQFNSLHEKLIARWQEIASGRVVHFTSADCEEDIGNLDYMRDVALQAGVKAEYVPIAGLGWEAIDKRFVDEFNRQIEMLFKLYPWEWMTHEAFGNNLMTSNMQIIEPAWKMLLSNKAILPILWELYPNHPYLLPAFFEPGKIVGDYVKKPLLSREGANIELSTKAGFLHTDGDYGEEGFVYQAYQPIPNYRVNGEDNYMVVGSWIVGDEAAGIGMREDESPITKNTSRFVPHYFV
jgi:glutathionylspermidine synthase